MLFSYGVQYPQGLHRVVVRRHHHRIFLWGTVMEVKRKSLQGFDKESIIKHLQDVAEKLGKKTLSVRELKKYGEVSSATIHRKFGGFSKALIEAGLKPSRIYKRNQKEMVKELAALMHQLCREPTKNEINELLTYNARHYEIEFGDLKTAFDRAEIAIDTPTDEIKITVPTKKDSRKYGKLINFRGMQHAPVNELGVVFLFGMLANEMNFRVESVQAGFPDCDAKQKLKDGTFERVSIEFEFKSNNFKTHGHDVNKCDLIICWIHDWEDCPLSVIELSTLIKDLQKGE